MTDYPTIRAKAMSDLVRDPREVVYAADALLAEKDAEIERLRDELIRMMGARTGLAIEPEELKRQHDRLIDAGLNLSEQLHTVTLAKLSAEAEREFIIGLHAKNHPGCGECSEMFLRWKEST